MNLKSRKLVASAVIFGSATVAMFWGVMNPEQWMDASLWTLTIYVGGNSVEHLASGLSARFSKK